MIKCPYCPSTKFDFGKIKLGNNGSAGVIYCAKCEKIISVLENNLNKPHDTDGKPGVTTVQLRA